MPLGPGKGHILWTECSSLQSSIQNGGYTFELILRSVNSFDVKNDKK